MSRFVTGHCICFSPLLVEKIVKNTVEIRVNIEILSTASLSLFEMLSSLNLLIKLLVSPLTHQYLHVLLALICS